jgi:asparagine synthase (glutamine-hydrolysing)
MCGIAGVFGSNPDAVRIERMVESQRHRGPDATGVYLSPSQTAALGHNRLSIIDLSDAGRNPMSNHDGSRWIVFNGEIYNYLELRAECDDYPYRSKTDTEVILAAYERWGEACLDKLVGMFAFLLWDQRERKLFAARDRFGVKPINYAVAPDGSLLIASEIKALHAAGVKKTPSIDSWATYLSYGLLDHCAETFWDGVRTLPGGHMMTWQDGETRIRKWYDLAERVGSEFDSRPAAEVEEEYLALATASVRLRFRSDVPVGINLSGGLDSSTLLGLVQVVQGAGSEAKAFTAVTGDERYDELPWARQMIEHTRHPGVACALSPEEVPALAVSVQRHQDEPFAGLPTLSYAVIFERARREGVIVLLDGQGMDEQWAGYDYYQSAVSGGEVAIVQGVTQSPVRPESLIPSFSAHAKKLTAPAPFDDRLRNMQYRDIFYTKIPRVLRYNDRISMRASTELREPFLDHRLFELALKQPAERKLSDGRNKVLLRRIARRLTPERVVEAPKRAVATPQREWLRGPLNSWANEKIESALKTYAGSWLDERVVRSAWREYSSGEGDNSFYIWQWMNLGLMDEDAWG